MGPGSQNSCQERASARRPLAGLARNTEPQISMIGLVLANRRPLMPS
jgi:hypothetical protein